MVTFISLLNGTIMDRKDCMDRIRNETITDGYCPVIWDGKNICIPSSEIDKDENFEYINLFIAMYL